ncbi:MAG: undecaprenyl-diphosphate phosphatase [Armatimonadota bacterium]
MTPIESIILGIVEGLTEYLPISSTGHLYLVAKLLGIGNSHHTHSAINAYSICVQLGAILAVTSLYSRRMKMITKGIAGSDINGRKLVVNLLIAFAPAVAAGLLLEKMIKSYLFGLWPISIAWVIGGFVILAVSRRHSGLQAKKTGCSLEQLTLKQAACIGCIQCIALWPGVSRSLATILGAVLVGVSVPAAVEFSFLLGLVTLGAATFYEASKHGHLVIATFGWISPLVGLITAYISAVFAVRWMVSYINKQGMNPFGYYRIVIGGLTIILLMTSRW